MTEKENQVRKRAVFYLSGYDPRGARHYHSLFQSESAKQGGLAGYDITVGQRRRLNKNVVGWDITFVGDSGEKVETDYHFLDYSRVISKSWRVFELGLYQEMVSSYTGIARMYWEKKQAGMLRDFWKHFRVITFAAALPLIIIVGLLLVAVILASAAYQFVAGPLTLRVGIGILTFLLAMFFGRMLDKKLNHYWLLRAVSFIGFEKYVKVDGSNALWGDFGDVIYDAALDEDYDEVLLVGHSVGSVIGIEVLSQLLEKYSDVPAGKISYMTIGGIVQFPAAEPKSKLFQRKLVEFCWQTKVDWVDLGARADGACYSCVHPFWVMPKQVGNEESEIPRLFPVKFFESFSAKGYKNLKKDRLKLHFQYLMASELGCGFDYFLYVSGGQRLESHFPKNT
jgi:hypothetical protein